MKVKTSKLTNAYYGKHLERNSSASCQTFITQTEKVNTYWQLCTQGRSQTPKINGLHTVFFRESLPSRSEGECSWGLKMHHSWHPVHFPLRGGTWQWILGNRDLAGAATAEKTSLTVVSAQSLVQPGAACWLNVCAGRHVLRLNAAVLTLTHEGAGAADQAEKAAFRRESSTFTAEKTERRGEERRGSLVSAGVQAQWAKVQVQSGSDHIRDLHGGSRNGSAALHVFLLCRIKSTATFFPWKAEKQPSINGKSCWEAGDRLTARCFSVSQKNRERFKLRTGN